jgi:hypothetical protein
MADNFDLKKFLKENKSIENLNPILKKDNLNEGTMRDKIREMIINELNLDIDNPGKTDAEEADAYDPLYEDEDLDEAKKKDKEVEDVEITDTETTDTTEEVPAEEAPTTGGLEDVAANMEGTESELMGHLMDALKISKGMGNEKLETQIGNTLKFFVSEYIGSGQE